MFDAVDVSRLVDAVVDNELADCKRIVHAWGADIITADFTGLTALMLAALWGHPACVRLLLAYGADSAFRDKHGRTALDCARIEGHFEALSLLEGTDLFLVLLIREIDRTADV
eukprot:m.141499 g.141499  ORF g.141499 m.141499 type:complete len:113 (+) comp52602_c0_seq1:28-366(+)